MQDLQNRLRDLMNKKAVTAARLEKLTGVNRNTIYSITAGTSKNPSAQNLKLIAEGLGISLNSLITGGIEPNEENLSSKQIQLYQDSTNSIINYVIKKKLTLPLEKLISLINEVYNYSSETEPYLVDNKFVRWIIDQYLNSLKSIGSSNEKN
jgi:transcriptional regulator with XRE-family HTH domain